MAAIGLLSTLANWAQKAFGAAAGALSDPVGALTSVWHYITSVHNVLAWLVGGPQLKFALSSLYGMSVLHLAIEAIEAALHRLAGWIWLTMIVPVRAQLLAAIAALKAWTAARLAALAALLEVRYQQALAYTRLQVTAERQQRVKADLAEHAAMLKAVAAALATVQRQAASGYDATRKERLGVIGKILDDLAARDPLIKGITKDLSTAVLDLVAIDDPLLRIAIGKLLQDVISKLGVDKVTGDLLNRLIGQLTGHGRPAGLEDVTRDVGDRLNALEAQWADFMAHGGPEVEQAGDQWKTVSSLVTDAAILGMFGLAVADPAAWATGIADTVAIPAGTAADGIMTLIRRA